MLFLTGNNYKYQYFLFIMHYPVIAIKQLPDIFYIYEILLITNFLFFHLFFLFGCKIFTVYWANIISRVHS